MEIRHIGTMRVYLTVDATKTLICAFVLSKLDYCNSLLSGWAMYLLRKLQKIQNSAAIFSLSPKHANIIMCKLLSKLYIGNWSLPE